MLGFFLVDGAHTITSTDPRHQDERRRKFKIALKATRFCLDVNEHELAMKVLERCSEYAGSVDDDPPIVQMTGADRDADTQHSLKQFVIEYLLMRIMHAWKTSRLDLAEHFFGKLNHGRIAASGELSEKAADLMHRIGKSQSQIKQWGNAIVWCERAVALLDACDIELQSQDVPELRLELSDTLLGALLKRRGVDESARAVALVESLTTVHGLGHRLAVLLMQVQVMISISQPDISELEQVVSQIITTTHLTDKMFKM